MNRRYAKTVLGLNGSVQFHLLFLPDGLRRGGTDDARKRARAQRARTVAPRSARTKNTPSGRVERRRDRFRPMGSRVSALSSIVANSLQAMQTVPPPQSPLVGMESGTVSTRCMFAQNRSRSFHRQVHKQLAPNKITTKPANPPGPSLVSNMLSRFHHKGKVPSSRSLEPYLHHSGPAYRPSSPALIPFLLV
jgi:hypothetical protein